MLKGVYIEEDAFLMRDFGRDVNIHIYKRIITRSGDILSLTGSYWKTSEKSWRKVVETDMRLVGASEIEANQPSNPIDIGTEDVNQRMMMVMINAAIDLSVT